MLPQLRQGATPEHAFLGLQTTPASGGGAQVAEATAGGPSAAAGLRAGDVVTEVDGEAVQTPDDVASAIDDDAPGDRISLTVSRGGSEQEIQVTLGTRPEQTP